jgi:hypothetical protein
MPPRPSRSGALVATAQRARAPDARSASCRSPPRPGGPDVAVGPCRAPRPPGTVQRRSALPLAQEPGAGVSTSGLAAPQDDASCSFQARTPCVTGRAGTSLPTRLLALYWVVENFDPICDREPVGMASIRTAAPPHTRSRTKSLRNPGTARKVSRREVARRDRIPPGHHMKVTDSCRKGRRFLTIGPCE